MMFASMAQIRIVDDWLRSPVSPPSHYRSVMVISEKWAEQRVLMRAFANSRDQTMPTIVLHGIELAIGPAGLDQNGPWGIHVGQADGIDPHQVKAALEEAAKRIAGSKGNPPRLQDESQTFDREPTGNWGPGGPRVLPQRTDHRAPDVDHVLPMGAARVPQGQIATHVQQAQQAQHVAGGVVPTNAELRRTPMPRSKTGKTRPPPMSVRTALGYTSGSGAQSAVVRLGLAPQVSARLGRYVDRVVPSDFALDPRERRVLNALGEGPSLSARAIGHLIEVADAVSFMEALTAKLEQFGLGDLVEPGDPSGGEPTYRLRA
jgi:hypothetical protein